MGFRHGSRRKESSEQTPPFRSTRAELIALLWVLVAVLVIVEWVALFVGAVTKSP
jgi:hypothetical protein